MIQSYIRDEDLKARWDINDPRIRPLHQSIIRGWIETADTIRDAIRTGEAQLGEAHTATGALEDWLWGNIRQLQKADIPISDQYIDLVMDAYLEWGVRNYPITDKITQHTLDSLERLYAGDPDDMLWDAYLGKCYEIIHYQTERNRKAPAAMTREEMLRRMEQYDTATLGKMLTAVEYQTKA